MKQRITLTMDPSVSHQAKYLARALHTSVSGLVETLLKAAAAGRSEPPVDGTSFAGRWRGKLAVNPRRGARFERLKQKYKL